MNDDGFVFMPGGGMSAWVWRDLDPEIRARSVLVSGRIRNNTYAERTSATLGSCADYVKEQIVHSGFTRVTLVAHSGAGILAPLIAKRADARVGRIVFISANIPRHGTSALQAMSVPIRTLNRMAARAQMKTDSTPARKYERMIRTRFCNTSFPAVVDYVLQQQLLTEPLCVYNGKVDWTGMPEIPMTYIRLLRDRTASLHMQDRMAENLNVKDLRDIDSDHMVMLSHPGELNEMLHAIAGD